MDESESGRKSSWSRSDETPLMGTWTERAYCGGRKEREKRGREINGGREEEKRESVSE